MLTLLTDMMNNYASSVGLDPSATYGTGTPLRPVVPLDVGTSGVLVLGAYPSARFMIINGLYGVAVADNLGPFEPERWFDGEDIREQPSAVELQRLYLGPLGLERAECWITDLVKVFLFKKSHRAQYRRLGWTAPQDYRREDFAQIATASLPWLFREVAEACPKIIITLGTEVAEVVRGSEYHRTGNALLGPPYELWEHSELPDPIPMAHLCHPGNLMRREGAGWLQRHQQEHIPALLDVLCGEDT